MANDVFANGREVSCKSGAGKSICSFPDVCFTPPENPATPPGVPIPYPNTGMAGDTTSGSKKVKISGKEIMLKNKSYFKKSVGDEAGCAAKKGIVTSVNRGKVYFNSWSMNVKVEGENAVRHLDLTTHNHASFPCNTAPWPYMDETAITPGHDCYDDFVEERSACKDLEERRADRSLVKSTTQDNICADTPEARQCREKRKCRLAPFSEGCCKQEHGAAYSQPHHLVEDHWIKNNPDFPWYVTFRDAEGDERKALRERVNGDPNLRSDEDAPCVCATEDKWRGEHGEFHVLQGNYEQSFLPGGSRARQGIPWDYQAAKNGGLLSHALVYDNQCNQDCLEAQLDNFYGDDSDRRLNPPERIPPNTDPARGYTEQEAKGYINPDALTHKLPLPGG